VATDDRVAYADSSALVKLVIDEPESRSLHEYLTRTEPLLASSRVALVEVPRATSIADPSPETREKTRRLLEACLLVRLTDALLREAAELTSLQVRTLDAIHLATAKRVEPDEMIVYDARLAAAAAEAGLETIAPGA
jgi:predicted nucleic acid-binding protein